MVEGGFRVWDLAKPVIAQVHGWCLAGGSELAVACDLVYVAEDAQIGYPAGRTMSPPDNQYHAWLMGMRPAMEMMLTGDAMSGVEAVRLGFANRAHPAAELEAEVVNGAARAGIAAQFRAVAGDPFTELTRLATEERADAVVVGTSEHAGHRIVGSLATRLVRSGKWPVIVVP